KPYQGKYRRDRRGRSRIGSPLIGTRLLEDTTPFGRCRGLTGNVDGAVPLQGAGCTGSTAHYSHFATPLYHPGLPSIDPGPDRGHLIRAINDVVSVMRRRGHAGVIGGDAQFAAHRQVDRADGVDLDQSMLLIRAPYDGIAVGPSPRQVECEAEAIVMRGRLRAAVLGQREAAGIDQDTARAAPDDAGEHGHR